MSDDKFSDPESEGLPSTADDDSSANPGEPSSRIADGPNPAALPADAPSASFDYGTTAWEQRHKEPLEQRLQREEPETELQQSTNSTSPGQLVETNQGIGADTEKDLVAQDRGPSTSMGAEEQAMRVRQEDETPSS